MKWLGLPTTTHPQPYTIGWFYQGRDLHVMQQRHLPYNIKPFTDQVLCVISPLDVCDVLSGQPYMWKWHVLYESSPYAIIVLLGNKFYKIPEVAPSTSISLVTGKKCSKLISKTRKFVFLMIRPQGKKKTVDTISIHGDEPQFLVQFGLIWPTCSAQTIHFLLLMHSFLGLFVLFVGRRVGILSTWLMHDAFRFLALKGRKRQRKRRQGDNEVALLVFRRGCPRSWGPSSWFPPRTPSSNPSPHRA